jgi:hypothetical protein
VLAVGSQSSGYLVATATALLTGSLTSAGRRAGASALLRKPPENYLINEIGRVPPLADLLASARDQQGRIADAIQTLQPLEQEHQLDLLASFHLFLYEKAGDARDAK